MCRILFFKFIAFVTSVGVALGLMGCENKSSLEADGEPRLSDYAQLPDSLHSPSLWKGQTVFAPRSQQLRLYASNPLMRIPYYMCAVKSLLGDTLVIVEGPMHEPDTLLPSHLIPLAKEKMPQFAHCMLFVANLENGGMQHALAANSAMKDGSCYVYPLHNQLPDAAPKLLPQHTWRPIQLGWEAGAPIAIFEQNSDQTLSATSATLLYRSKDDAHLWVLNAHQQLRKVPKRQVQLLPTCPELENKQSVWVPVGGRFQPGVVLSVHSSRGGAWIEFTLADKKQTEWFAFGSIATDIRTQITK